MHFNACHVKVKHNYKIHFCQSPTLAPFKLRDLPLTSFLFFFTFKITVLKNQLIEGGAGAAISQYSIRT